MALFRNLAATGCIAMMLYGPIEQLNLNQIVFKENQFSVQNKTQVPVLPPEVLESAEATAERLRNFPMTRGKKSARLELKRVALAPAIRQKSTTNRKQSAVKPLPKPKIASISPNRTPSSDPVPRTLSGAPLARFHQKLARLQAGTREKPVVIVHIGDSHIASDSFTRGIRTRLQKRFGDAGRGSVIPARAFKYGVAQHVKLAANGPWKSWMSKRSKAGVFGLSGVRVESASSSAKQVMKTAREFDWAEVTVVTGPKRGSFDVTVGDVRKRFSARSGTVGSKTFRLEAAGRTVTVNPAGGGKLSMLHWATGRNQPGVRYINFGQNGATVSVTKRWNAKALASDLKAIDPDLIVYGFGTNEGYNDNLNIKSYEKYLREFAGQLREHASNADLLILGSAAGLRRRRGVSCGNGWFVPPKLAPLRVSMKNLAPQIGAGFWDWSNAMGGDCGINSWAQQGLAARDRVHLTPKGYDASAKAFVKALVRPLDSPLALANKP